ncbi:MAG: DnaJ domain-containing protein [Chloroflexota bacterium]
MTIVASGLDLYGILQVDPRAEAGVIQAAYRALALRMHPDHSRNDNTAGAMAMLNRAYGVLRDPGQRSAYDQTRSSTTALPIADARTSTVSERLRPRSDDRGAESMTVSFGRYQGWTLQQISQQDPEYLEWLRRHSSGIGYRRQIDVILDAKRTAAAVAAPNRRRR